MSSFNRFCAPFVALFTAGVLLGACGFQPLYGTHANAPQIVTALSNINVLRIDDRTGQMMRTALQRRLSSQDRSSAAYDLHVQLEEAISELAVERDAFATRANLILTANFELTRRSDQQVLRSGTLRSVASYNILASEFATHAAKTDSRNRAVEDLADSLHTQLSVYFAGAATQPASTSGPNGAARAVYP